MGYINFYTCGIIPLEHFGQASVELVHDIFQTEKKNEQELEAEASFRKLGHTFVILQMNHTNSLKIPAGGAERQISKARN
jgi:hypothetical protein